MNKLPWMLFGVAVASVIYVCSLLLNAGVELDDARSEASRYRERNELTLTLVRKAWLGKDRLSVEALSKELQAKGVVVGVDKDSIEVGDLIFQLNKNVVTEIHYIGE